MVFDLMKNKIHMLKKNPRKIYRYVYFDTHDYRKTVFLAGSARSGTTWVQDIINFDNEYRIMFEPFYPAKVKLIHDWKPLQYLSVGEDSPLFVEPMRDILRGNVRNKWIDRYNQRFFSQKRIIKAVRGNLVINWIKSHYPEIPIILLFRHPCAVANSKINIIKNWFPDSYNPLDRFLVQDQLIDDYLRPYEKNIKAAKTIFEQCIFMWCIEYFVPISKFNEREVYITFYENLCVNTENEIRNLFSYIQKSFSSEVMKTAFVPSPMSGMNSAIKSGADLIKSWRNQITDSQIQTANEILHLFGLDVIYNDSDLPLISGEEILKIF